MSVGRVLVGVYALLVLLVAFLIVPSSQKNVHYRALRFLGRNTRLAPSLLLAPRELSMENRLRLARERPKLEGRYLSKDLKVDDEITPEDVVPWPLIKPEDVAPIELPAEPDWMLLNQGTRVEVWLGENPEPEHAQVLAIVPSGTQWIALLQKKDLKQKNLGPPSAAKAVRIEVLAGPPVIQPPSAPIPAATPAATPASSPAAGSKKKR